MTRARMIAFTSTLIFSILLVDYGSIRDSVSWYAQRELCHAAARGNIGEMRVLIFLGVSPEGSNTSYMPILSAAWDGQTESVKFLLEEGVDVNSSDKFMWTPLMSAVKMEQTATVELLLNRGADTNTVGDDGTALDIAVRNKNQEIVDLLRRAGAKRLSALVN